MSHFLFESVLGLAIMMALSTSAINCKPVGSNSEEGQSEMPLDDESPSEESSCTASPNAIGDIDPVIISSIGQLVLQLLDDDPPTAAVVQEMMDQIKKGRFWESIMDPDSKLNRQLSYLDDGREAIVMLAEQVQIEGNINCDEDDYYDDEHDYISLEEEEENPKEQDEDGDGQEDVKLSENEEDVSESEEYGIDSEADEADEEDEEAEKDGHLELNIPAKPNMEIQMDGKNAIRDERAI